MAKAAEKLSMDEMIRKLDEAKKVNPLDLSSDQDLTIALMNLVSLEEHFFFSGAKTGQTDWYDLIEVARGMRGELMKRIVDRDGHDGAEVWCISKHLLAASMRIKEVGDKANAAGKKEDARDLFSKAYDLYSLFWGINMNLIDLDGAKKTGSTACKLDMEKIFDKQVKAESKKAVSKSNDKSTVKRLGRWVKNAVNCCIE
ncbi:MAG: hypothetical protein LBF37_03740 [Rickettsiales bacterium]|jgi:hypothetical protein|nr:hypothetical protein [Rickettsiales bacterium]